MRYANSSVQETLLSRQTVLMAPLRYHEHLGITFTSVILPEIAADMSIQGRQND